MNTYQKIANNFGVRLIIAGFQIIINSFRGLKTVVLRSGEIKEGMNRIVNIYMVFYDKNYYTTDKESWDRMLDIVSAIIKVFKWILDRFDCDNRARFVSSLCALLFGMNTCGYIYCERTNLKTGEMVPHYANLFITDKKDIYLYDVDNGRRRMFLNPGQPLIMGNKKYKFLKAYFG